jgi:hypothetical protein
MVWPIRIARSIRRPSIQPDMRLCTAQEGIPDAGGLSKDVCRANRAEKERL